MTQLKRIIVELGMGNDLHGEDYTKAARRAVQDAMHHSSLGMFRTCGIDPATMQIELTIAAQEPGRVDLDAVAAEMPYGQVTATAVHGGLNVVDHAGEGQTVIVNAGIVVRLSL
ncbi:MAG: Lin0512 family protein [Pseudomonadota bacterium]